MDVTANRQTRQSPTDVCGFCHGYRVVNAQRWINPACDENVACPRCGRTDQPEHPGDVGRDSENAEDFDVN